ncbi:hypothetical protein [Amycolatopsis sp. NPDC049159]|uniref:hypothetical protein n=1 Tax=Amycolatopsis sp. NPDC049159 TaxID=3157210 RepID=UPI0033E449B0
MNDPFMTSGAVNDPFMTSGAVNDPFMTFHRAGPTSEQRRQASRTACRTPPDRQVRI